MSGTPEMGEITSSDLRALEHDRIVRAMKAADEGDPRTEFARFVAAIGCGAPTLADVPGEIGERHLRCCIVCRARVSLKAGDDNNGSQGETAT